MKTQKLKLNGVLNLDSQYSIERQPDQFVLRKTVDTSYRRDGVSLTGKFNKKTSKEIITKDMWYYANLSDALIGYLYHSVDIKSNMRDMIEELKRVVDRLKPLVNG